MFEEFTGIPMHPLLVHAAVVFIPLLGLVAVGYAFVPTIRPHLRWVLAGLVTVLAVLSIYYVVRTGDSGAKAVWDGR